MDETGVHPWLGWLQLASTSMELNTSDLLNCSEASRDDAGFIIVGSPFSPSSSRHPIACPFFLSP